MPGVEAEAELLAAITLFFERVGLTSKDVGIKVSSRKVGGWVVGWVCKARPQCMPNHPTTSTKFQLIRPGAAKCISAVRGVVTAQPPLLICPGVTKRTGAVQGAR